MAGHSRKKQDLTGQRFGMLTVLGPAEKINGYLAWTCRCDCGREIAVQEIHLRRGLVRGCGCRPVGEDAPPHRKGRPPVYTRRDTRKQDMTGRRFGSLTVLRQAENIKDRTAWWCRCDCGRELVVRSEYLRRGKTTHCGCQSSRSSGKKLELTGQRFGKLTALRPAENLGKYTAWWCRCDCGREIAVTTAALRKGIVSSCGCDMKPPDRTADSCFPNTLHIVDGTCVEMLRSKTTRCNNTSGVTGVYWNSRLQRWQAEISFKGRRYHLGCFERFENAVSARRLGEEQYHDAFLEEYDRQNAARV